MKGVVANYAKLRGGLGGVRSAWMEKGVVSNYARLRIANYTKHRIANHARLGQRIVILKLPQ